MCPILTSCDRLDHEIAVAYIAFGVARSSSVHCPSGENARLVEESEGAVDRLLDERLAAQQ